VHEFSNSRNMVAQNEGGSCISHKDTIQVRAEVNLNQWPPSSLDCSELLELVFSRRGILCPDGSWNQHKVSTRIQSVRPGDIAFWASLDKITTENQFGIYHAGIVFSNTMMVEARAKDTKGRFGEVIYRSISKWICYEPFKRAGGFRRLNVLL